MFKSKDHPDFLKYQKFIVSHKNYTNLPDKHNNLGKITWVRTEKTSPERAKWWDKKVNLFKVNSRSDVARLIHPKELKGLKPCSVCGKKLSIFYLYPNKILLKKINLKSNEEFKLYDKTIFQIIDSLVKENNDNFKFIANIFNIKSSTKNIDELKNHIKNKFVLPCKKGKLGPGVMSNAPDRLDGFHTYNGCCRETKDTGRHKSNMSKYTRDRRAFEYWSDGDFVLANSMMGQFRVYNLPFVCKENGCNRKSKPSADHVGPISLGFTHRVNFKAICSSCNSKKNNRMTYSDVVNLINDEKKKLNVISWHSKYLWDKLKNKVKNGVDSKNLSKLMRKNMHFVLSIFSLINNWNNGNSFLKTFLDVNIANNKYSIYNFSPNNLNNIEYLSNKFDLQKKILEKPDTIFILKQFSDAKTKERSKEDYLRISFECLNEYSAKNNRKYGIIFSNEQKKKLFKLEKLILNNQFDDSKDLLKSVFDLNASILEMEFK